MSYLDLPRVRFFGDFQADVSTVNNDPDHFVNNTFSSDYQKFGIGATNGWFNPVGSGAFRLLGCTVRGAIGPDGPATATDPVLRARIGGSTDRVSAKIVDLDPDWQMASQLWGLRVELVADGVVLVGGDFEPAAFRDIWMRGGLALATARYQSVLRNLVWAETGVSPLLDELRARTDDDLLSIRLTTFGYDGARTSTRFTLGRTTGVIGPHVRSEPRRFVAGRRFVRAAEDGPNRTPMNFFDGRTEPDGTRLTVDLANALPINSPPIPAPPADPTPMVNLGELSLGLLRRADIAERAQVTEGTDVVLLGDPLPYRTEGWLSAGAGIVTVDVPVAARADVLDAPLAVLRRIPGTAWHVVVIRESAGGMVLGADIEVHRAAPDDRLTVPIHVRRFGRPVPVQRVSVQLTEPFPRPEPSKPGALTAAEIQPTGDDGRTICELSCADPGNPRGDIDGQIFQARFGLVGPDGAPVPLRRPMSDLVTVLLFTHIEIPPRPTWADDVAPILTRYANLYPVMSSRMLDLASYPAVARNRAILRFALSVDVDDPNHMPVTRDLSPAKRAMIVQWLDDPHLPHPPRQAAPDDRGVVDPVPLPGPVDEAAGPADSKEIFARRYLAARAAAEGDDR